MDNLFLPNYILFINGTIFETISECDSVSSKFNATVAAYLKHLSSSFFGIYSCFSLFYLVWRIYKPQSLKLLHNTCNALFKLNQK